jgi:HptB-dependent secretion and biofilm anti anti-sigma factor
MKGDPKLDKKRSLLNLFDKKQKELSNSVDEKPTILWNDPVNSHEQITPQDIINTPNNSTKIASSISEDGSILITVNAGTFNIECQRELRKTYTTLPTNKKYIIDFNKVKFIDSAGMGLLLMLKEHQSNFGLPIEIINCSTKVLELLKHAKFNQMFTIS